MPFDDDRSTGTAFAGNKTAIAPAGRVFAGSDLAAGKGSVAFLAQMSGRASDTGVGISVRVALVFSIWASLLEEGEAESPSS